ncbi:MAG: hypothetical protein DHS20C17_23780 [Cyclobacteriaceae bacterium]|nr:MAG: hypothetical protein DHS20C17_23780 [Cyclobacteriaceae bacterium]
MVRKYKADSRGPYLDLRWFCRDGSFNPPGEPCPKDIGGVQRARYKPEVTALANSDHIFLGQILSTTDKAAFWDQSFNHSRLKQYQLEKWLKSVDDGWISRKAQFYRGAVQAEDEEAWGVEFLKFILANDQNLLADFYLLREASKDIPHRGDDNTAQLMRSQSKVISDSFQPFMNLRVKIHGQPEVTDIQKVKQFKKEYGARLTPALQAKLDELAATMELFFDPVDLEVFSQLAQSVTEVQLKQRILDFVQQNSQSSGVEKLQHTADLMWQIREQITSEPGAKGRLALLDISLQLEKLFLQESAAINLAMVRDLLQLLSATCKAVAASGFVEIWEWQQLEHRLTNLPHKAATITELNQIVTSARRLVEWGTGMAKAVYEPTVKHFEGFEPMAHGFIDDRIRGSVALILGNYVGDLGSFLAASSSLSNQVLTIGNQSHIRGLNPGYARGILVVVPNATEDLEVDPGSIYVFDRPPADLKPVAGIATVSEGNLVSHVQLLARNLGIPNAVISISNLNDLQQFQGREVFYAVSNAGNVILKLAEDMTAEEQALFVKNQRKQDRITIPVDKIQLETRQILNLREVNASSSGLICGPKAANLGELKAIFPENVVEGLVIPFGIFLDHMKQNIPGETRTYWDYLNTIFQNAREMESAGKDMIAIESYQLKSLENLRSLIKQMPLKEAFRKDMETQFKVTFGQDLGKVGVFLRSDTNMEDLKDFSGAGLNLTLFNVVNQTEILEGIKSVWASPYTERSFKWRQKYLTNPENVYPSILIIPGVNNDYSGVIITKGVVSGDNSETTVAFSKGVGGAVEGQVSETWILRPGGRTALLSPSRESLYTSLAETGGTTRKFTSFHKSILEERDLNYIENFRNQLISNLKAKGVQGPYDVELGFKDQQLWLFQVRPFVENKRAASSKYLNSITPRIDGNKKINLNTTI